MAARDVLFCGIERGKRMQGGSSGADTIVFFAALHQLLRSMIRGYGKATAPQPWCDFSLGEGITNRGEERGEKSCCD